MAIVIRVVHSTTGLLAEVRSAVELPGEVGHSAMALAVEVVHLEAVPLAAVAHSVVEAIIAADHSAEALPAAVVAEVPSAAEAIGLAEAREAATAAEAVFSAEAVKIRTSAFIIRLTSRIGHLA